MSIKRGSGQGKVLTRKEATDLIDQIENFPPYKEYVESINHPIKTSLILNDKLKQVQSDTKKCEDELEKLKLLIKKYK